MSAEWSQSQVDNKLTIYSDGSQSSKDFNNWDLFTTNIFSSQDAQALNIVKECEVYDAEFYVIQQAVQLVLNKLELKINHSFRRYGSSLIVRQLFKGFRNISIALLCFIW